MEQDNGRFFNCAESVLIASNREHSVEESHSPCLRIASMFGGGIVGTGEACGAVTGALMYLGLALGTDGTEDLKEFSRKRKFSREIGKKFVQEFIDNWGSQRCSELKAMDKGEIPPMGKIRSEASDLRKRCNDYVDWCSEYVGRLVPHLLQSH